MYAVNVYRRDFTVHWSKRETPQRESRESPPDLYGPSSELWQQVVPDASSPQDAYAMVTGPGFRPHAPYHAFTRTDWERNCAYWGTKTYDAVLAKHKGWPLSQWFDRSPPSTFWTTWCQVASWVVPPGDLLWVGGAYARHPGDFPGQSDPAWIFEHLRPLGIQPSKFMQTLRRGAADEAQAKIVTRPFWAKLDPRVRPYAIGWPSYPNKHVAMDFNEEQGCIECLPVFPFTLTPAQQEQKLSAHLWKHNMPSVWLGEGSRLSLRQERCKRQVLYAKRRHEDSTRDRKPRALQDFMEVHWRPVTWLHVSIFEEMMHGYVCTVRVLSLDSGF